MITWNNLDTLESFKELSKVGRVDIKEAMSGDNGAKRVKEYNIPMAEGFTYNFAAKQVDADVLEAGRMAYLSGLGRTLTKGASASSPLTGYLRD